MSLNNNIVKKRKIDQNVLEDDKEGKVAEVEQLKNTIAILEEELKSEKKKIDGMKRQIECPVCLEVPRTGPVYTCPNGHLVCQKCKRESCPMCRELMGDYKSLVAVAVIDSVLHDCKYVECEEKFPLDELEEHEKACMHRIVSCPHHRCAQMVPLSKLLTHLETSPSCCFTRNPLAKLQEKLQMLTILYPVETYPVETYPVKTYRFDDHFFALNVHKSGDYWHFLVFMFASPEVCKEYNIKMEVYESDSPPDARLGARVRCHPCSIDKTVAERKGSGLIVHSQFMEELILKEDGFNFTVSMSFF